MGIYNEETIDEKNVEITVPSVQIDQVIVVTEVPVSYPQVSNPRTVNVTGVYPLERQRLFAFTAFRVVSVIFISFFVLFLCLFAIAFISVFIFIMVMMSKSF